MPPVADISRGSGAGGSPAAPNSAGHVLVDGVEFDVSNLLCMRSAPAVIDGSTTIPNYYPHIEPSPWQPETRKRTGLEQQQPRPTSQFHHHTSLLSPSKKEVLLVAATTNTNCSPREHHRSNSFSSPSSTEPLAGNYRKYLTLKQRFDSSLRAVKKAPPPPGEASSSNNSVRPPPPPPPPMEDDDDFEQNWISPPMDEYERRKKSIEDPFRDSPYISRSERKSLNYSPSSMGSSSSIMGSSSNSPSFHKAPLQVEISPGFYQPLLGASDTMQAVSEGRIQPSCCMACSARFSCVLEALYVVCPYCKTISHTDAEYGLGVGLGFLPEDL